MSTGPDENGPSKPWRLKAVEEQELIRANLIAMRHHGRWNFVNDLQPLAPRRLAKMDHAPHVRRGLHPTAQPTSPQERSTE